MNDGNPPPKPSRGVEEIFKTVSLLNVNILIDFPEVRCWILKFSSSVLNDCLNDRDNTQDSSSFNLFLNNFILSGFSSENGENPPFRN